MNKQRLVTNKTARESGMHYSKGHHCPECGCSWYGNKNLCGEGHRVCYQCYQDYWIDVEYNHQADRKELSND